MSFTTNLRNYLTRNHHEVLQNDEWSSLVDDYTLLDQIGSGSFGRVFKAKFNNDKICAVKCISKLKSPNIKKILSEVSIHIRLVHKHVLQLFTISEDSKSVYLMMELCRGGSLSQLINEEICKKESVEKIPLMPYELISILIRQICDALDYLCRCHIVHRDLNLNNILLVNPISLNEADFSTFHIKLADFGLAIDLNRAQTESYPMGNTICGTPGFISPEIWTQGRPVTYKSDIFSLGSIMYACITGNTPKGDIDLKDFQPMTSDLIGRLMEQNPDNRPKIKDIQEHIFVSGRVDSKRLFPMRKPTKRFQMSITPKGNISLCFENNLQITTSSDGSQVSIADGSRINTYNFYELPKYLWKEYAYLTRFIQIVKAKTAKITIHCSEWFRKKAENEYITKCVLMENGDFEVTVHNQKLKENQRFIFNSKYFHSKYAIFKNQLEKLYKKVCDIEARFTEINRDLKIDLFPMTFGINAKMYEESSKPLEDCSFTSNKILRSIQINDIGHATQFSNGSIQVNFNDGTQLCLDAESQIFFMENGVRKKFNKDDILPEVVLQKISRLPQVINHLRTNKLCDDSMCSSINSDKFL